KSVQEERHERSERFDRCATRHIVSDDWQHTSVAPRTAVAQRDGIGTRARVRPAIDAHPAHSRAPAVADSDSGPMRAPAVPADRGDMNTTSTLAATRLTKVYPGGAGTTALAGVSITVEPRETVAIMGPSGSGKTS